LYLFEWIMATRHWVISGVKSIMFLKKKSINSRVF
jgi:hypothetical protein